MILTPDQTRAVTQGGRLICVSAAAGSGKTRVLVERIVNLLEGGARLDRIAAITFTEKAAGEMKVRLRHVFRARAEVTHNAEEVNRWREFERQIETAHIETIHAFCTSLLRECVLDIGLDPDFGIMDEAGNTLTREEILRNLFHSLLEEDDPHAFLLCSELGYGAARKLVGTLLLRRAALESVIAHPAYDDPAALIQFHARAVEAEKLEIYRTLGESPETQEWLDVFARFEGACPGGKHPREILRRASLRFLQLLIARAPVGQIEAAVSEIHEIKLRGGSKKDWTDEALLYELARLQDGFRPVKKRNWMDVNLPQLDTSPETERRAAELSVSLAAVCRRALAAMHTRMEQTNILDFDALIQRTHRELRDSPAFREKCAAKFDYFLIDEFQDTDHFQLEIVRMLSECAGGPSIFVVGDPKQSIYYFRGAEVGVFNEVRHGADVSLCLRENFRTVESIAAFVNYFFGASRLLQAVEAQYLPMTATRPRPGHCCVEILLQQDKPENKEEHRRLEAEALARRIMDLCSPAAPATVQDHQGWRQARFGDIALLFRALSSVHLYENALRAAGIPYVLVAGGGFYQRQEVIDVLNVARVALDPYDERALLAFLRSPMGALHDESIFRLARTGSLCQAMFDESVPPHFDQTEELSRVRTLLREIRGAPFQSAGALIRRVLDATQYEAALAAQYLGVQKISNVRKLLDIADGAGAAMSMRAFAEYVDQLRGAAARESEAGLFPECANAVLIMTVHKSKGLEFPIVFVPDMCREKRYPRESALLHRQIGLASKADDGRGSSKRSALMELIARRIDREEQADSNRCLYVAMTRARDYLVLCGHEDADQSSWFGAVENTLGLAGTHHGEVLQRPGGVGFLITRETEAVAAPAVASPAPSAPPDLTAIRRMIAPVPPSAAAIRSISVTAILDHMARGLDPDQERDLSESGETIPRDACLAMMRGSAAHRMLETCNFVSNTWCDLGWLLEEFPLPLAIRENFRTDLERIQRRFEASALAARIRESGQVQRELPFQFAVGGVVVDGTIDLLLDGEVVVDYKTGKHDRDRQARYEWQLLLYAAALRRLRGRPPREGILFYLDTGEEHLVAMEDGQIDSALRHAEEIIGRIRAGEAETASSP